MLCGYGYRTERCLAVLGLWTWGLGRVGQGSPARIRIEKCLVQVFWGCRLWTGGWGQGADRAGRTGTVPHRKEPGSVGTMELGVEACRV